MKRKIELYGEEYFRKDLVEIAIYYKKSGFKKNKEMVVYDNGIAMVEKRGGLRQVYSTDSIEDEFHCLFCDKGGEGDNMLFEDINVEKEWQSVFIYMYREDGALLLYVNRSTLNRTGVRARVGSGESVSGIRQEAFNVAALFSKELLERLVSMEETAWQEESELSLLSVEEEYGK